MKRLISCLTIVFLLGCLSLTADAEGITFHFADVEEGRQLIRSTEAFYESLNQKSLDYFMQKKGATAEAFADFRADQVTEFPDEVKAYIQSYYEALPQRLADAGIHLPDIDFTVVATTGQEAPGAAGYTHGSTIYLCVPNISRSVMAPEMNSFANYTLLHELFHCLTRSNPDFRADMYSIIGFRVNEKEIDIPPNLKEQMILNPDVERHDATAFFTINGEKKECYLLFMTDGTFDDPDDSFFAEVYTGVVTVKDNRLYRVEDVDDFWDVVGRNTDYVEDPEECMADNFSYALLMHLHNMVLDNYESPEVLQEIYRHLTN